MVAKVRSLRSPGISSQQQSIKRLVGTIRSSLLQKIYFQRYKNVTTIYTIKRGGQRLLKMPSWEAWVERTVGLVKVRGWSL